MEEAQEHFEESLDKFLKRRYQHVRVPVIPPKSKYLQMCARVLRGKAKTKTIELSPSDYLFLRKYDVALRDGQERLVEAVLLQPMAIQPRVGKIYLYKEEIFDTLHKAHIETGHGNADDVMRHLKPYQNVTINIVHMFLKYCKECTENTWKEELPIKENNVCQIGLIDMHEHPDRQYKHIFVFRDNSTKFILLYPLVGTSTEIVAKVLLDIFTIFGAPSELMCDNMELTGNTIQELSGLWPELKDISLKFQKLDEQLLDVKDSLMSWIKDKKSSKWSEGLRQLQLRMNGTNHSDLSCSPYEAMFGRKLNVDNGEKKSTVEAVCSQKDDFKKNFECNNNDLM
ncbi:KRAB-A domain-containing protein 2-like [Plutella xylostella]|uniref:KRAB-A domain-containing protein 2-like n=1 Tax=Plutella xylostella TaxID=51655 RepID=UPI0020326C28|nr:KRAB-A domain-containing protein 2-like [Plutella xylostella]